MVTEESEAALDYSTSPAYPIRYSVVPPGRLSRGKAAKRALGALITWIVPAGLGYISDVLLYGLWGIFGSLIALGVIGLPLVIAFRIRAKGLGRFQTEDAPVLERIAQYAMATAAYGLFLTDDSPREAIGRSVRLEIKRGGNFGWLRATVTPILLLPHILLLALFAFAFMLIVPVCAVVSVVCKRYPRWFFGFTVGYLAWIARALGYWVSLTDRYPPFSFRLDA